MARPFPIPQGFGVYPRPPEVMTQPPDPPRKPDPATPPVDRSDTPPELEPAELDSSLFNDVIGSADMAVGTREAMRPPENQAPVIPYRIVSGADPSKVGGWDRIDQAYDATNARGQEAIQEAADISTRESNELTAHYENLRNEANALKATRLQHQQENIAALQQRQAELEKQTKIYTQNLADRKAYWSQPSNIVSAIGFALLPMAGVTGGVGIKLINNSIQQDLENRKQLANDHLGALKSNISGYRQLAGDIEAGDSLAEAEAYRVAGLEVQRLAAHYQGEKSQAQAKAVMAELNGKMNEAYMRAFYQRINVNPQVVRDPMLANAMEGRPGYQNYLPGKNPAQSSTIGQPATQGNQTTGTQGLPPQPVGTPNATAPSAVGPSAGIPVSKQQGRSSESGPGIPQDRLQAAVTALGGKVSPEKWKPGQSIGPGAQVADASEQPVGGPGRDSWIEQKNPALAKAIKAGIPHALETWEITKNELLIRAGRKASESVDRASNPKAWERKRNQVWEEMYDQLDKEKIEIAKAALPKKADYAHYSLIQKDMSEIEKAFGGDINKVNEWLYKSSGSTLAPAAARDLREFWRKQGDEAQADRAIAAADRFKQLLNGAVVNYYHQNAGANMTEAELDLLKGTISKTPSWQEARNFIRQQSSKMAAEYRSAIGHGSPTAQKLYLIENMSNATNLPSGGKASQPKSQVPWEPTKRGTVDPKTNRIKIE